MYFFDPVSGRRRRALLRDQFVHGLHKAGDRADARIRDLGHRAYGAYAEACGTITHAGERVSDAVLIDRVRSMIGRHTSHARAIEVCADNGTVTLCGPVLESEVNELLDAAEAVPGVCDVVNHLSVHDSPRNIPALQGTGQRG
jgi:osmotically-inducible protein OsmY